MRLERQLLNSSCIDIDVILVDKKNEICFKKGKTLSLEQSAILLDCLKQQNKVSFMQGEYDVNVQGIQSAYQPYELEKFEKLKIEF